MLTHRPTQQEDAAEKDSEWYRMGPHSDLHVSVKVKFLLKGRLSYVLFIGERVETPPNSSLQQSLQPLGFVHFLFSIKGPYAYLTLCHLELRAMGFDSGIWIDVAIMTDFLMFPGLNWSVLAILEQDSYLAHRYLKHWLTGLLVQLTSQLIILFVR